MIVGKYIIYSKQNEAQPHVELWVGVRPTHLDRMQVLEEQGELNSVKQVCALGTFFCNEFTRKTRIKTLMCRDKEGIEISDETKRTLYFEKTYKSLVQTAWDNEIKNDTQADLFKRADISAYLLRSATRY